MKNTYFFISMLTLVILTACAGGNGPGTDGDTGRMVTVNQPLEVSNLGLPVPSLSFSLSLTSYITPPTVSGTVVNADDITLDGTVAYVSYNVAGNVQSGAIDQVQTVVAATPLLTGSKSFNTTDIHGVFKSGNSLYAVGSDLNLGAALYKIDMTAGLLSSTSTTTSTALRSYAGTGVLVKGSTVYTTSGDGSNGTATPTGGLDFYDSTTLAPALTSVTTNRDFFDMRSIAYNAAGTTVAKTDSIYVVSGKYSLTTPSVAVNSSLYEYSSAGVLLSTTDLGATSNNISESKSAVTVGKTMVAVSQGGNGFKVLCAKNKSTLVSVAGADETPTIPLNKSVTNSITVGPGLIFAANGEAGVYVYAFKQAAGTTNVSYPCGTGAVTADYLGKINLGSNVSVNNVKYQSLTLGVVGITASTGVLYVATTSGFKLVSLVQVNTNNDILDFN